MLFEKSLAHEQYRGGKVAVVPPVDLVHENVGASLEHEPGDPRFGQPGPIDLAALKQGEGLRVVGRCHGDVAPTGRAGLIALVAEPGAQGYVLGVAELRGGEDGAGQVGRVVDAVPHDEGCAAARCSGHDDR